MITIIETLKELRNEIGATYQSGYAMTNEEIKEKLSEIISELDKKDSETDDRLNKIHSKMCKIDKLTSEIALTTGDLEDELKESNSLSEDAQTYLSAIDRRIESIDDMSNKIYSDMLEFGYILD